MKKNYQKHIDNLTKVVNGMKKKLNAKNQITDDARAEVEGRIAELQAAIDELKSLQAAAEEGDDDRSAELSSQVKEVLARLTAIENKIKTTNRIANDIRRITNSKDYAADFLEVVKNSADGKEFKEKFAEMSKKYITNGISEDNIEDFIPAFVVNEIKDQFVGKRHRLLELVDWTGLPCFKALYETKNDMANTHTRGTKKTEQELKFDKIEIRPAYVYKYITIDKEVERESRDAGDVLLRYIARELTDRLLATIENYILIGSDSFNKPKAVAFADGIMDAMGYMEDSSDAIAVMSPRKYLTIKKELAQTYNRRVTHDDILDELGVVEIVFNKSVYTPASGTFSGIWFLRPDDYKIVGDSRPDQFEDFNLAYNKKEYLTEIWIGGGISVTDNFLAMLEEA